MQPVNVLGVNNPMQFPDDMDKDDIREFLRKRFTKQAVEGAQPVDINPLQAQAQATEQSLAEKAGQGISNALYDSGIISDRYGAQRIGGNVTSIGEFLPVIGDATAGDECGRAVKFTPPSETSSSAVSSRGNVVGNPTPQQRAK